MRVPSKKHPSTIVSHHVVRAVRRNAAIEYKSKKEELIRLRKIRVAKAETRAKREAEPGEWVEVRDKRVLGRVQLR